MGRRAADTPNRELRADKGCGERIQTSVNKPNSMLMNQLKWRSKSSGEPYIFTTTIEGFKLRFQDRHMSATQLKRKCSKASLWALTKETPTDVTLKIGQSFTHKSHKQVLKENIPYFKAMFSDNFQESSFSSIDLGDDVEPQAVHQIMNYVYKGSFSVNASEVQSLFQLADRWGMVIIKDICAYFMTRELDASNCLDLLQLAEIFSCSSLIEGCQLLIARQFPAVVQSNSFLDVSSDLLAGVIQLPNLNLGPCGEEFLLENVIRWMQHEPETRRATLPNIMKYLDLSSVSSEFKSKWASDLPDCFDDLLSSGERHPRWCSQYFMVFCGYLQSRTGPSSPRTSTVEEFVTGLNSMKSASDLPECPSFGTALNLFGKIIYLSVTVGTDPKTDKRIDHLQVWTYNPLQQFWKAVPETFSTAAKESLTSCLVNGAITHCALTNKIYAVMVDGGVCINVTCTDGDLHCDIERQLPSLNTHLEENLSGFQAVCHKGRLYVLGGSYGPLLELSISDSLLCLSEDGNSWETRAPMIIPRTSCSAAVLGDFIYVTGGYGGHETKRRQQSCEVYSVLSNKWSMFSPLRQSRSHHCTVAANNKLYTIGGKSYASQKLNMIDGWHPGGARIVSDFVEVIQPSNPDSEWERLARMTKSRCHFSALVI